MPTEMQMYILMAINSIYAYYWRLFLKHTLQQIVVVSEQDYF